jgi:hypothetical protein
MTSLAGARRIDPAAEADRLAAERTAVPPDRAALRAILRECVTVVAPGEVLVIRVTDFTPAQLAEYGDWLRYAADELGIKAIAVIGDELGIATPAQEAAS